MTPASRHEVVAILLESLDRAYDKPGWQGPNLRGSLRGVSWQQARRTIGQRKSIWQQALHAAYWKQRVLNKLVGTQPFPRRGSNWPSLPAVPSGSGWRDDVRLLDDIHARLRDAVEQIRPAQLEDPKQVRMILGIAAHDVYHAGQIRLLRRLLTDSP
ncbi:MAG TPA: DinB family protein [Tepidisphaeraceae bacterium]|nr:DinB family protein [Tepidisphaeraceae bacterium]